MLPARLELAKCGAEHRYRELKAELESLTDYFPHLGEGFGASPAAPVETVKPQSLPRRRMSAAARKAVSERLKKYWAASAKRRPS